MAAGGLESGLNTAVNAVPLAEMVGGSVRNAWEKTYVFLCFAPKCVEQFITFDPQHPMLAKHVAG